MKLTKYLLIYFLLLGLFSSCAGYKVNKQDNPFARYGITSLSVPMFQNNSSIAGVSYPFTKEIINLLRIFPDLKVKASKSTKTDAVLIGVIRSSEHRNDAVETVDKRFTDDVLTPGTLGNRRAYFVPYQTQISLTLDLYLIKNPRPEELELLESEMAKYVKDAPRIVLNERIAVTRAFTRNILDGKGIEVNQTQNLGVFQKSLNEMAKQAANNFRQMVLYAF